jgi:TolB protein
MRQLFWLAAFGLFTFSFHASAANYISVGQAKVKKSIIAIAPIQWRSEGSENGRWINEIRKNIQRDLEFMDFFRFVAQDDFPSKPKKNGIKLGEFEFKDWTPTGAEFLLKTAVWQDGGPDRKIVRVEAYLFDIQRGKQLLAKRYYGSEEHLAVVAHSLSGDVVERLTGRPGIFNTKIAMSCNKTGKKEIYLMDFDGTNVRRLTKHRSIAFAPAWSPDGTKLAYSLYTRHANNVRNIDLFEYNFRTNRVRLLSNRRGINSGAFYSPDGRSIALTMSFLGNPEIFTLDTKTKTVSRLTRTFGFDVDPSWAPNGKAMAFASSRSGKPMIYSMDAKGGSVKRLTFAGRYNATPSWSPTNNKIVFASWIEKGFDIFLMNPNGSKLERLTKRQGSNEDPQFSPDGNFIVFSSDRTGKKNVYMMNTDGTFTKRLTYGMGDCVTPRWSNPPPKTEYISQEDPSRPYRPKTQKM